MTFVILFSFVCFAESPSRLLTYKQHIEYVFQARRKLLESGGLTNSTPFPVQAQFVLREIDNPSQAQTYPGDKRALSIDRIQFIITSINVGETQVRGVPVNSEEFIQCAAENCFVGEVVGVVFDWKKTKPTIPPSIAGVYDTLVEKFIIAPHEPEFNGRKINLFLTGRDPHFNEVLAATLNHLVLSIQNTPLQPLSERVELIIEEVRDYVGEQRVFEQPREVAATIEPYLSNQHDLNIPLDIIQLVIETFASIEGDITPEKVIQQLETNFTNETRNERSAVKNPTTAADVRARALEMHIIEPEMANLESPEQKNLREKIVASMEAQKVGS